jgi:hypothetical protein
MYVQMRVQHVEVRRGSSARPMLSCGGLARFVYVPASSSRPATTGRGDRGRRAC